MQIQGIVNNKDDVKKRWENSGHSDEKYSKCGKVGYGDLDGFTVVEDWKKWLQQICEGYKTKDIFNANEAGLFYRALPT